MKNSHSNEIEQFKNNYKQRIAEVAEKKTEWIKDFKELYQKSRNEDKRIKDKENNELNKYLKIISR